MQTGHMKNNRSALFAEKVDSCAKDASDHCVNIKHKRGDTRDDGKVFWGYHGGGYEYWVTLEKFQFERAKAAKLQREYYKNNRYKVAKGQKACYEKHRSERIASRKRYCKANKEKLFSYAKRYFEKNKDRISAYNSLARARRRNALPVNANKKLIASFYEQANRLSTSWAASHIDPQFRVKFHVDHIIPLSRGGMHDPSNLQVIPAVWNLRKNNNPDYPLPSAYANAVKVSSF